jgi:DNA adenine methylase
VESLESLNRRGVDYIVSYDGSCGEKQYGNDLPNELGLRKVMLNAGLSSQALLLGKKEVTYEALYLSQNLQEAVQPRVHKQLLLEL